MSRKRTGCDGRAGRLIFRQRIGWIFFALFISVFLPRVWAEQNPSLGKRQMELLYAQGRAVFYATLEEKLQYIPLNEVDKTFLISERYKKKGPNELSADPHGQTQTRFKSSPKHPWHSICISCR